MIDSHCHLDHEPLFSDLKNVIQRSKEIGVKKLLTISTSIESFYRVKEIVNNDEIIFGTIGIHPHEADKNNVNSEFFTKNLNNLRSKIDNQNINYYIDYIVNRLFEANKYFNDQEPWKKKDDKIRLNTIVYTTLEIVRKVTFLLYPINPQSSLKALKIFSLEEKDVIFQSIGNNEFLKKGSAINKIDILFNKIEKEND